MNASQVEDIYRLSPTQHGLLFHTLYAPETGVYFVQYPYQIVGDLNHFYFEQAWRRAMQRHTVLRTAFYWEDLTNPMQCVYKDVEISLTCHDWRTQSLPEQEESMRDWLRADQMNGFDLGQPPLWRLALMRVADDQHHFICSMHHILLDGWSWGQLFKEVLIIYSCLIHKSPVTLPPVRPFRDYITWLQAQDMIQAEKFWRETLHGFTAPTPLLVDNVVQQPMPFSHQTYDEVVLQISANRTSQLRDIAKQYQVTLNTVIQAVWAWLLSQYSGERDIAFGVTSSGRPADIMGIEHMVGLFINTLPIRVQFSPRATLVDLLQQVQKQQMAVRQYEYSPLVQVQGWSEVPAGMPLFNSILVFENYFSPQATLTEANALGLQVIGSQSLERTNYPLTLIVHPNEAMSFRMIYDKRRFQMDTIQRILNHMKTWLDNVVTDTTRCLTHIHYLPVAEMKQLVQTWNMTEMVFAANHCVHQLIEQQVSRTPDVIAVRSTLAEDDLWLKEQTLTYAQVNEYANQLAHYLRQQGINGEMRVGLCLERSLAMVVAVLGILKVGGTIVPLDPNYPHDRLAFMIEDAGLSLLLTQSDLEARFLQPDLQIACLDRIGPILADMSGNNLPASPSESLAYIVYTSGSTGKPKGVQVPHRTVINLLTAMAQTVPMTAADKWLAVTTLSFDIAYLELFLPLITGMQLIVAHTVDVMSGQRLLQCLHTFEVTIMQATPVTWQLLLDSGWQGGYPRKALCGGEMLPTQLAQQIGETDTALWNVYGPTETTIWSLTHEVTIAESSVPIGRPLGNTTTYVLDDQLYPVPIGVTGELYIGGEGVTRGYWQRPQLTAIRFIPDPFSKDGRRLYRTGDLVRYRSDGNIEFLGRIDHQVKVRGFRIELGEVEMALSQYSDVNKAIVTTRVDEMSQQLSLVAYLVVDNLDEVPSIAELRAFLEMSLPRYMIPTHFIFLDSLPLTPNGKVNRLALPAPDSERPDSGEDVVVPRTPLEKQVAYVWEKVLNIKSIGLYDNFFELGGNSLLAIRLLDQLETAIGYKVTMPLFFDNPTIAHVASIIQEHSWPNMLKHVGEVANIRSPIIAIKPEGRKRPFFLAGPLAGIYSSTHFLILLTLTHGFDEDQPYYGVMPAPLATDALPLFMAANQDPSAILTKSGDPLWQPSPTTIQDAAAQCVEAIKRVQPKGPYNIGGHCSGGMLTFEIALQLEAAGEEMGLVLLLDTDAPATHEPLSPTDAQSGASVDPAILNSVAWFITRELGVELNPPLDFETTWAAMNQMTEAESWVYGLNLLKEAGGVAPDTEVREIRHLYLMSQINLWTLDAILDSYQPQALYNGKITLVRAAQFYTDINDPLLGWQNFTTTPIDLEFVAGDHGQIFQEENIPQIATLIANCIK